MNCFYPESKFKIQFFFGGGAGVGGGARLTIFFLQRIQMLTRNVTVCNKCPRRSLIMTLIPGCDLEHSQGFRVSHKR